MDTHIWIDKDGLTRVINRAELPRYARATQAEEEELLRLAQREADLTAELALEQAGRLAAVVTAEDWKRTAEERLGACDQLRARIAALEQTLTEKEHQLALAKACSEERLGLIVMKNGVIERQRAALEAEHSRGRKYCAELAEKAEIIRRLQADRDSCSSALAGEIMAHQATKMANESRMDDLQSLQRDAQILNHLTSLLAEASGNQGGLLDVVGELQRLVRERDERRAEAGELKAILREHGLLPAKYEDEEAETPPGEVFRARKQTANSELAASLKSVKEFLGELKGKRKSVAERFESLEESRGNHAVMLTDHADRLKAVEHRLDQHRAVADMLQEGLKLLGVTCHQDGPVLDILTKKGKE